jgi:CDP-glycerol glycerophosphotransferase (TagB/SpsB family)
MRLFEKIGRRTAKIVLALVRLALKVLPLRQDVLLFESFPELSGSPRMVYDELRRRGFDRRYRMVWAVDAAFAVPEGFDALPFFGETGLLAKIRAEIVRARAKAIVDSNRFVRKLKPCTYRLHGQHGGVLKYCHWYYATMGDVDCCLTLSENLLEAERKAFSGHPPRFVHLGYPSNDPLFDKVDLYALGFWERLTGRRQRYAKVIGWMPTYRQHRIDNSLNQGTTVFPFGVPLLRTECDFRHLNDLLRRENILLAIQMHHAQADNFLRGVFSNIVLVDPALKTEMDISNACMMQGFDALVTDYSGVYHEFVMLDRPIAITLDDYETYSKNPGFALDFFDWIKGEYLKTAADLERFVDNVARGRDEAREERRSSMRRMHNHLDNQATKRVTDLLCAEAGLEGDGGADGNG